MAKTTTGPSYYQRGSIQVWDFIRDQGLNFHLGNAIKYICRYGHKGNYDDQLSDLKKAIHYLNDELNNLERSRNREDLPKYNYSDTIVFTGAGVQESLSDQELGIPSGSFQAAQVNSGGIQRIFGSGSDVISYESEE